MSEEIKWSDDQQAVIDARDCEVLVSAAAGSGKTSVLVERIYRRIMDEKKPVDIDRFVVVTFTKAAAAEMKERLRKRMEEAAGEAMSDEMREHLRRQIGLVPSAHVSTVHSFCNYVISQYFYRIGLDPNYGTLSEQEEKMIKQEVIRDLLERKYSEERNGDHLFFRLADLRALSGSDEALEDWILNAYNLCVSEPFPDDTLAGWIRSVDTKVEESVFLREIIRCEVSMMMGLHDGFSALDKELPAFDDEKREAQRRVTMEAYAGLTADVAADGTAFLSGKITAAEAYNRIKNRLEGFAAKGELPKSPGKNDTPGDAGRIKRIALLREQIENDSKLFFSQTIEQYEKDRIKMAEEVHALVDLVREFSDDFMRVKREMGKLYYDDLEQYALQILYDTDPETGKHVRSEAALELADFFEEIMIDEYQDSNRVQDTILWSVCKNETQDGADPDALPPWESTASDRFMVGDIKQSIYRFRNACPELFENKMNTFQNGEGEPHRRIDLKLNFRSRPCVLDATNAVFEQMMKPDIGGVLYDEPARLKYGLKHREPGADQPVGVDTEILCPLVEDETGISNIEAAAIAARIEEMVHGDSPIYIEEKDYFRRVRYRDIVILSRSVSDIAGDYTDVFLKNNIPFVTNLSEGFYDSREIRLMTQFLTVIDNPRQDIPLAGVLLSPLFHMTEEDLALLRSEHRHGDLYELVELAEKGELKTSESAEKLAAFAATLRHLRERAPYISLSELVNEVITEAGVWDCFATQKEGARRIRNIEYLLHLVTQFEKNSSGGIHAFAELLKEIRDNNEDIGEAVSIGEEDNVVRMMTIHKSKGLEFPVVFLAGADKSLDAKSVRAKAVTSAGAIKGSRPRFVFHTELGVAGRAADIEKGVSKDTVFSHIVNRRNEIDKRGEDMRLLYVAMTRARDRLIVVSGEYEEWENALQRGQTEANYYDRYSAKRFTDMLRPAVSCYPSLFSLRKITVSAPYGPEEEEDMSSASGIDETVLELLNHSVPERREDIPTRVSVSELKRAAFDEPGEEAVATEIVTPVSVPEKKADPDIPRLRLLRPDTGQKSGAELGTITHHVMATIDFSRVARIGSLGTEAAADAVIGEELDRLVEAYRLQPAEREVVSEAAIAVFFRSELGRRMAAAEAAGTLRREQPFVISAPAHEINEAYDSDEDVMIQGIIDAYFEEDGKIILMDYKTDRVGPTDGPEVLKNHYRVQIDLYRKALKQLTGKEVSECYLYSFALGRELPMDGR